MKTPYIDSIMYQGKQYFYEHKGGRNGDICLATEDPKKYCNGFFTYSDKDLGDGLAFVIIKI